MELLEHRNSSDVGGGLMQSSLEVAVSDRSKVGETRSKTGGLDLSPERLQGEGLQEGEAGPLEVFHPGEAADERAASIVVADALRCQVKITTRRNLHLRIANHTARDVYVRLVGHGGRIAGANTLEQSKMRGKRQKYDIYL